MPCYDPTPTDRDLRAVKTHKAINLLKKKLGRPFDKELTGYNELGVEKYLDMWTRELCSMLNKLSEDQVEKICYDAHDKESRFLADWWEEHQEIDKIKVRSSRRYRLLTEGEIILSTDRFWNEDTGEFIIPERIGESAPDPHFTSHNKYFRLVGEE